MFTPPSSSSEIPLDSTVHCRMSVYISTPGDAWYHKEMNIECILTPYVNRIYTLLSCLTAIRSRCSLSLVYADMMERVHCMFRGRG